MGAAKAMKAMKAKRISKIRRASFRRPWCSGGPRSAQSAAQQGGAPEEQAGQGVVEEAERGGQARIQAHPELDQCRQAARKELKVRGFVAVNGKTQQGKAIYVKAKA